MLCLILLSVFYSAFDTTNTELLGVCIYEGRPIRYIEFPKINEAAYNSQTDAFDMELELFKDDNINISIFNTNGELVSKDVNVSLAAGKQIINLNTSDISNGVYIISFKCNYYVKNLVFIKNK